MQSNLDRFKKDLDQLILAGDMLEHALKLRCCPKEYEKKIKDVMKEKTAEFIKKIPDFPQKYQLWYSEAKILIKQLLPDRMGDFVRLFEKPKNRKSLTHENYVIEDCLQGLSVTLGGKEIVGPRAAIPRFEQQLNIVKSARKRFESSLFDIKRLVEADLFDSELEAASALNKAGFERGAGAMAGVVLEAHLLQMCKDHNIKVDKKNPAISDLNDLLKTSEAIEIHNWRFIQHLGDVRNICDHKKGHEPTKEEIEELITGVGKVVKTIF